MDKIPKIYAKSEIYLSLAGSGNPWDYFKPSSKLTLRALHDGYTLGEIQKMFHISEEELFEKINLLIKANLLRKENENYYPTFLIVNKIEAEKTYQHTKNFGKIIADELLKNWKELVDGFTNLEASQKFTIKELSLVLIGSKLLDIGMLEALVKDGTLLVTAPNRPSPERPDAKYYFYMVEGKTEYHGKYGENETDLPWENWTFVTFGQNIVNNEQNKPREKLEEKCSEILKQKQLEKPHDLALELNIPILSKNDSLSWKKTTKKIANRILLKIKEKEEELLLFYNTLKASQYTNNTLGEFVCWYIHIAYAWAIDYLIEEKKIYMPKEKFEALIFYTEGPQGLLVK